MAEPAGPTAHDGNLGPASEPPPVPVPDAAPNVARWRWWFHLVLLAAYPLSLGIVGSLHARGDHAMLPATVGGLLIILCFEVALFATLFAIALSASRADADQLLLRWRGGARPIWLGALYSIGLRLLIAAITLVLVLVALVVMVVAFRASPGEFMKNLEAFRPHPEALIDPHALMDPLYFALAVTLVSFVVAGFREELWRAGMLAGLRTLFPRVFGSKPRMLLAVAVAAVIFGLGHLPQGWVAVGMTAVLGMGLGAIMVLHKSLWEATWAHGFFDAASFTALYLVARFNPDLLKLHPGS